MDSPVGFLVTGLAALVWSAVVSTASFASDDKEFAIYLDTDAPGFDYRRVDPPSFRSCQSRCGAEASCKAFTYNRAKQVCFLKYKANVRLVADNEAISGIRIADEKFSISRYRAAHGYDYDKIDPLSASECRSLCGAEAECRAFSYNVAKRVCFLKHKAGIPLIRHNEAITGIKSTDASPRQQPSTPSGTGFAVSTDGLILTNHHVVEGCQLMAADGWGTGLVKAVDPSNDLALVKFEFSSSPVAFRSTPIQIGENVFAVGYPYAGELGLHFTKGSVSSATGPGGDPRLLQFTAPVQLGNSGGPLLDESGLVVGVVRAILTQSQNVNFAIHADIVTNFLRANNVDPITTSPSDKPPPSEIAKRAKLFAFRLSCISAP